MKLIQTKDYLLLIDEEAEIKEDSIVTNGVDVFIRNSMSEYSDEYAKRYWENIIAYYPLTKEAEELDLPLLPNPFKVNVPDIEYEEWMFGYTDKEVVIAQNAFIEGYKAAQSKQFSAENIRAALRKGEELSRYFGNHKAEEIESFIQSLSTQQLPKEFIPEKIWINSKGEKGNKFSDVALFEESINDYDAILKLKTITNSEGKEILQGEWIY